MADNLTPRIIITGGAGGLGREAAFQLAARGCAVVIVDRDGERAAEAAREIAARGGTAESHRVDLARLDDVAAFADAELARGRVIDVMLNNAGLLPPDRRTLSEDGHELAFAVSFLAHFALTGRLLPALARSATPRVVSVSSLSHGNGRIDLTDLRLDHGYSWSRAYADSKLACLLYARELQRRVGAAGGRLISVVAHPGVSRTPIGANRARGKQSWRDRRDMLSYRLAMRLLGQDAAAGAVPLVHASIAPDVKPGGYYGPTGWLQARGPVGLTEPAAGARDDALAAALFDRAEQLSGVRYSAIP